MSLLTNLVSYWKLDEASGNAVDSCGANTLTETSGTIGSATGKVGNCRDFEAGDTEYFSIADNASLSTGDIDFSLQAWVNIEALPSLGMFNAIVGKYSSATNQREYWLVVRNNAGTVRFALVLSSAGTAANLILEASTFGAPSTGTWYLVHGWHDSVANLGGISVNAGGPDTASYSSGVFDGTSPFAIGAQNTGGTPSDFFDGLIDEVGFWKRVLTSDERTFLYNSGNGRAYPFGNRRRRLLSRRAAA